MILPVSSIVPYWIKTSILMKIIVKIETETVLNLFLLLCFNGNISDEKGILLIN